VTECVYIFNTMRHRSRIRYLSKKNSRILTNLPKLKKIVKIRKKFVKCPSVGLPRVPGYLSGTRIINYPCNFLLPDLQKRFALYSDLLYTNKCIINERYIPEHQNKLNIYDLQNYECLPNFFNRKKFVKFVKF